MDFITTEDERGTDVQAKLMCKRTEVDFFLHDHRTLARFFHITEEEGLRLFFEGPRMYGEATAKEVAAYIRVLIKKYKAVR